MKSTSTRLTVTAAACLALCFTTTACGTSANPGGDAPSGSRSDCIPVDGSALIKSGTLQVGINATLPPLAFQDQSGKFAGERIELAEGVAKRLCLKVEWTNATATALLPSLNAKRIDVIDIGYFITAERTKVMRMIATEKQGVSVLAPKGNPAGIKSPEGLAGKNVATSVGSFEENTVKTINTQQVAAGKSPMNIQSFGNYDLVFQALVSGQVDAAITSDPAGKFFAEERGYVQAVSGLALTPTSLTVAPTNEKLGLAIVKALDAMRQDGSYDSLMKKYSLGPVDNFKVEWTG